MAPGPYTESFLTAAPSLAQQPEKLTGRGELQCGQAHPVPPARTRSQTLRGTHRLLQTPPHLSTALLSTQLLPSLQQQTRGTVFWSLLQALHFEVAGTNPFGSSDPSLPPPPRGALWLCSQHQIQHTQGGPANPHHRDLVQKPWLYNSGQTAGMTYDL